MCGGMASIVIMTSTDGVPPKQCDHLGVRSSVSARACSAELTTILRKNPPPPNKTAEMCEDRQQRGARYRNIMSQCSGWGHGWINMVQVVSPLRGTPLILCSRTTTRWKFIISSRSHAVAGDVHVSKKSAMIRLRLLATNRFTAYYFKWIFAWCGRNSWGRET